ncbi:MAG: hypothetical protein WC333_10730 [Dehalococcoidia bacterium]|jgi:uncharacterized membrane protein (DUF485 family)
MFKKDDMRKMTERSQEPDLYREVVVFALGRAVIMLFIVLTVFFLAMFISQILEEPVGSKTTPDWFYLAMSLFFVAMTFVVVNFSRLVIRATPSSLTVAYGVFRQVIPWEDIAGCYEDEVSALFSYGGYGIRMGRVNGKTRLVYNVLGGGRVVLELKKGRFDEFVFSTNDPDAVMGVIKERIGK